MNLAINSLQQPRSNLTEMYIYQPRLGGYGHDGLQLANRVPQHPARL